MPSDFSPVAQEALDALLERSFPAARGYKRFTRAAAGGFVVAIVHPDEPENDQQRDLKFLNSIGAVNEKIPVVADRIAVFSVMFRHNEHDLYSEQAALRKSGPIFEHGMRVYRATSLDLSVLVNAVDAEALMVDPVSQSSCRLIVGPGERAGLPLDRLGYAELEMAGMSLPIERVEVGPESGVWLVRIS